MYQSAFLYFIQKYLQGVSPYVLRNSGREDIFVKKFDSSYNNFFSVMYANTSKNKKNSEISAKQTGEVTRKLGRQGRFE
jgi:hypothetical protein